MTTSKYLLSLLQLHLYLSLCCNNKADEGYPSFDDAIILSLMDEQRLCNACGVVLLHESFILKWSSKINNTFIYIFTQKQSTLSGLCQLCFSSNECKLIKSPSDHYWYIIQYLFETIYLIDSCFFFRNVFMLNLTKTILGQISFLLSSTYNNIKFYFAILVACQVLFELNYMYLGTYPIIVNKSPISW